MIKCARLMKGLVVAAVGYGAGCASFDTRQPDFLAERGAFSYLPRANLVAVLSQQAHRDEFQIAYLPRDACIINLTVQSTIDASTLDTTLLDALIASEKDFYLVHNHTDRALDVLSDTYNPLYWLAPSENDIEQYLAIGARTAHVRYGMVTRFGLLTMETDRETFIHRDNPLMSQLIEYEARHVQQSLKGHTAATLESWAANYRGMLRLSFERAR